MLSTLLPADSPIDRRQHPAGMDFSVWKAADGWPHRAWRWPPAAAEEGEAPRGSLIFQSGRADFIEKYLEACAHWRARGWVTEGFDWRGQGGSGRSAPGVQADDRLSFDPLIDDLIAYVTAWKARTPGPHVLVAHSMGGHVALRACAERGLVLDALVLVAPMLALRMGMMPLPLAQALVAGAQRVGLGGRAAWRDDLESPKRQLRLTASRERYEDSQWWKRQNPGLGLGTPSWNWLGAAIAGAARIARPGVLESVRTPVLLLAAGLDRLVDNQVIAAAARRLPQAEYRCWPGARHELLREADSDRLPALAAIDDFLDRMAPVR
jgi:lysophospholipase